MRDWLKEGIDELMAGYRKDLDLIWKKRQDVEWKRDHYRHTSAILFQRILKLLESQVTETPPSKIQDSTRTELVELKKIIDGMISSQIRS